jgi:hypothetical protein
MVVVDEVLVLAQALTELLVLVQNLVKTFPEKKSEHDFASCCRAKFLASM